MDISRFSDEMLQDLFEAAFEDQVASMNDIPAYEAKIERSAAKEDVTMEVTITGMAGSPSINDFKSDNVEGANAITVDSDLGEMVYELEPDDAYSLNATEYVIVYKLQQ